MQPHQILIIIMMYLFVGCFVGVIFNRIFEPVNDDTAFGIALLFWPVLLLIGILIAIYIIPIKLAHWICDKFA